MSSRAFRSTPAPMARRLAAHAPSNLNGTSVSSRIAQHASHPASKRPSSAPFEAATHENRMSAYSMK
jgi:hypothetical protein